MANCRVTLSANAGVCLEMGGTKVWIDAIHRHKVKNFSSVTDELWEKMKNSPAFSDPDVLFFTHKHPDHYSSTLIAQTLCQYPKVKVISPADDFPGQVLLEGDEVTETINGLHFHFFRLPHEGIGYRMVPNYGALISNGCFRILVAGDGAVATEELRNYLQGKAVDLALMNFPWATLHRGREFLETYIRPNHLFLCHLPFAGDDGVKFRYAARRSSEKLTFIPDVRLLLEPLQQETIAY